MTDSVGMTFWYRVAVPNENQDMNALYSDLQMVPALGTNDNDPIPLPGPLAEIEFFVRYVDFEHQSNPDAKLLAKYGMLAWTNNQAVGTVKVPDKPPVSGKWTLGAAIDWFIAQETRIFQTLWKTKIQ